MEVRAETCKGLSRRLGRLRRFKVTVNSHPGPASGLHGLALELPSSVRKTKPDGVAWNPFLAKTEFSAGEHEEQRGTLGRPPAESTACLPVETASSGNGEKGCPAHGSCSTHLAPACMSLNCPHHSPPSSWLSPHGSLLLLFMILIPL